MESTNPPIHQSTNSTSVFLQSKLTFIHTPKTAGSFANSVLMDLGIKSTCKGKGHCPANASNREEGITFTVIRDPVQRFESLMNFRLEQEHPWPDWPAQSRFAWEGKGKDASLDDVVKSMTDKDIVSFNPYKTLSFWIKNVDILITIDQLQDFLAFYGYSFDPKKYEQQNVSKKRRGKFSEFTKDRVARMYAEDVEIFQNVTKGRE